MPTGTKTLQLVSQAKAAGKPLNRFARDSQKAKLYKSESVIRGSRRLTEKEVHALIRKVRSSEYVLRNWGDPGEIRVRISQRHKSRSLADTYGREMILAAAWGTQTDVVLHELAHMYASPAGDPGHDWLFCMIYLDFIRKFMGKEQGDALKAAYKANKVRFAPPRKRKAMSPEQKAEATARMAKARAARAGAAVEPHVFAWYDTRFGGHERWTLVERFQKGASIRLCGRKNYALTRTTAKGVSDMLDRMNRSVSVRHGGKVMAIPASMVPEGYLDRDWEPVG